ncbi:MAG TPA: four helix bundle protein [Pyrinomonadaceae bacterium]|nr:four helix bundle protein [Pyrinomonadaceae bacterium]
MNKTLPQTTPERDLKKRTKQFALRVIKLVESLPRTQTARVIGDQLLRSSTSVPANYRAACRARSRAEFLAKLGIVEEETDESVFWMEMLVDGGLMKNDRCADLMSEGGQLTAIWVTSINTARGKKRSR